MYLLTYIPIVYYLRTTSVPTYLNYLQPHPEEMHLVCRLIERSLLPHINRVIDHHEHMFVLHNIAHLLCKGHLDDISALLLSHHLNSLTAFGGHDRQYFNELRSTVVSRRIFFRSQSLIAR
jgi:hypothetical protein